MFPYAAYYTSPLAKRLVLCSLTLILIIINAKARREIQQLREKVAVWDWHTSAWRFWTSLVLLEARQESKACRSKQVLVCGGMLWLHDPLMWIHLWGFCFFFNFLSALFIIRIKTTFYFRCQPVIPKVCCKCSILYIMVQGKYRVMPDIQLS